MRKHRRSRQALLFPQKSRRKYRLDGFHPLVPIEDVDGAIIRFGGRQAVDYGFSVAISGNINRASSRMDARW